MATLSSTPPPSATGPLPPAGARGGLCSGADAADTIEALLSEQGAARPAFYWLLIAIVAAALASLPAVRVDVRVPARGVVVPGGEEAGPGAVSVAAYVREPDARLVRPGQRAVLRFDAFPSADWGAAAGTVAAVADEPVWDGRSSRFRVELGSVPSVLRTPDGRAGRLTAGMAADVRIVVGRESLLRILRRKAGDLTGPG
jgi:multidrug efflux pump subunit AcrA (membrane-fusion protein)